MARARSCGCMARGSLVEFCVGKSSVSGKKWEGGWMRMPGEENGKDLRRIEGEEV